MNMISIARTMCVKQAVIVLFALMTIAGSSQNAPVTTIATISNANPGQIAVPITVTGFNSIGAISLCFDYPFAGLHFINGVPNAALPGFAIGDQDLGNGLHRITMGWFGTGASLPNSSAIMTINFNFIGGINSLEFYDNGPSCEYADASYNVLNDIPQSTYYINGLICGTIGNPGQITGNSSVCLEQTSVSYSVAPIVNASGYQWTVPPGASIVSGANTNLITVDYSAAAQSGNVSVYGMNGCGNGPVSLLPVTVNPLPTANAGPDFTIPYGTSTTLHAAPGGVGSFGYHWSPETLLINPNIQDPVTVNLTSTTVFTVRVTNSATQCFSTDNVVVTVTGGPLNVSPLAIPSSVCAGSSVQLYANAGGGSGNYTYNWSCIPAGIPPWTSAIANPLVDPDSSKQYLVTVTDGFNSVNGTVSVEVFQLPTATISGGDTLCGSGSTTTLTVDLTGTPPWSFYYTNGVTTWFVNGIMTTPYLITATDSGVYTVQTMADAHCNGSAVGAATVAVFPIPGTPVISVTGSELFSTSCCGNQWYLNNTAIAGATNQIYQPSVTAHYFSIVTLNSCSSDTSNVIYYLMEGVTDVVLDEITIAPNPARDYLKISQREGGSELQEIAVYSLMGEKLEVINVSQVTGNHEFKISLSSYKPGMYYLSFISVNHRVVRSFIVL